MALQVSDLLFSCIGVSAYSYLMAECGAVADLPPFFQAFSPICQDHFGFLAHPTMSIQSLPASVICKLMSKLSGTVKPVTAPWKRGKYYTSL